MVSEIMGIVGMMTPGKRVVWWVGVRVSERERMGEGREWV
jgi:hypothetical protein